MPGERRPTRARNEPAGETSRTSSFRTGGTFVPRSGRRFYPIRDRTPMAAVASALHPAHTRRRRMNVLKRLVFFAYGAAAYLVFLVTFLYAIAFVGGFAVPPRLDGPAQTPLALALPIEAARRTVFAVSTASWRGA